METKFIIGFVAAIVIILGGIGLYNYSQTDTGPKVDLTTFVDCLKQAKATFYGAFWCPHCQETKRMFGTYAKELPYVECSTPDGNGQLPVCRDKGIQSYPTWEFADGSRLTGELSFADLSAKTSCPLPEGLVSAPSAAAQQQQSSATDMASSTTQ